MRILLLVAFILSGCFSTAPVKKSVNELNFDTINSNEKDNFTLTIATDIDQPVELHVLESNKSNDVDCEGEGGSYAIWPDLPEKEPREHYLTLSRKGSPSVALYEWHICFKLNGVLYKAWRGFDPGPKSKLKIHCNITKSILEKESYDKYLCKTDNVELNLENYGEYSLYCKNSTEDCTRFESREAFELWQEVNQDPALKGKIAFAILESDFGQSKSSEPRAMVVYLSVAGKDPSQNLLKSLEVLDVTFVNGSEWRQGKGLNYSIGEIQPLTKSRIKVYVNTYCGPLCASGTTVELEFSEGKWGVVSRKMNWISEVKPITDLSKGCA